MRDRHVDSHEKCEAERWPTAKRSYTRLTVKIFKMLTEEATKTYVQNSLSKHYLAFTLRYLSLHLSIEALALAADTKDTSSVNILVTESGKSVKRLPE